MADVDEAPAGPPSRPERRKSSSQIRLANLPSSIAAKLAALDVDGDGILDAEELQNYHDDAQRTLSRVRRDARLNT